MFDIIIPLLNASNSINGTFLIATHIIKNKLLALSKINKNDIVKVDDPEGKYRIMESRRYEEIKPDILFIQL